MNLGRPNRHSAEVAKVALACVLLATSSSSAQERAPRGFALDHTDPSPAGDRFFYVPDARVRDVLDVHAALVRSYVSRPLRAAGDGRYIEHRFGGSVDLALAAANLVLLDVSLSEVSIQSGSDAYDSQAAGPALGDVRATLRVTAKDAPALALAVQADTWLPTGDEDALAGDGAVRFRPSLVASGTLGPLAYAANGGYELRESERAGPDEVGSGIRLGGALGLELFDEVVRLGPELFGTPDSLELLGGARVRVGDVVLGAAAGIGLTDGPGAAEHRVTASLAFVRDDRVPDPDGDGLTGERDLCPREPGFETNGCPAKDSDGDTISDEIDACPGERGLVHEDPRKHGCRPEGGPLPP